MKFIWEEIHISSRCQSYRAKVFGGWIVSNNQIEGNEVVSESMVFLPDPLHQWSILPEVKEQTIFNDAEERN